MKIFGARFVTVAAGLVGATGLLFNVNCGSSSNGTGTAGAGGHAGTTGAAGTSGTAGHGGTTGTAGTSGGGHGGGTAGAAGGASGGAAGGASGGAAGGTSGGGHGGATGGTAGSNTDGGAATAAFAYNFDANVQGFALNNFNGAGNLVNIEGGSHPVQTWDSAVGMPTV